MACESKYWQWQCPDCSWLSWSGLHIGMPDHLPACEHQHISVDSAVHNVYIRDYLFLRTEQAVHEQCNSVVPLLFMILSIWWTTQALRDVIGCIKLLLYIWMINGYLIIKTEWKETGRYPSEAEYELKILYFDDEHICLASLAAESWAYWADCALNHEGGEHQGL